MDLSRKRERAALKVRREPYWQKLAKGAYLGYRRGAETWLARYRDAKGKQNWKPLEGVQPDDFDGAKRAAEEWLSQLAGSPVRVARRDTVKAALETYLADLARHGRGDAAEEIRKLFKRVVYMDPIAHVSLESATRDDFEEWRDRLTPGRQPRTVNRHVRGVVAGLNRAQQLGHIGNPAAWKLTPLADDVEDDGETAVFLEPRQRKAIIDAAGQHLGAFLQALEHTGARPKEIASVTAGHFDGTTLRLAHRKGKPPKLRVRYVVLSADGVAFFKAQSRSKLPSALLFTRDGENPWDRYAWSHQFRDAVTKVNEKAKGKARIPVANKKKGEPGASAYSFRHARISELLQVHNVDPLTVAAQTGTSLQMIEKAYLRFIPSAMREKLAQVKGA